MAASGYEQEHALGVGVRIVTNAQPVRVIGNGAVREVEFAYTEEGPGGLVATGETFRLAADQVLLAIGQELGALPEGVRAAGGKIAADAVGRTGLERVWAGGDCTGGGEDLTVTAVAQGRDAAMDIHRALTAR
jgi:dihydropyrimidine dehydrogenase (NAD+) subunit PreT